ncbi:MAG: discoidin domain-containing protein [Bacteroidaceae bacterium]|nr:discoidin domain-containing protein [Bacteroidaceae bacterium]
MRKILSLLLLPLATMMAWTGAYAQTDAEYEAALAAISDGGVYYVKSDVGGTYYYLKGDGTLTETQTDAAKFIFEKTAGAKYGFGFKLNNNGKFFSNPPGTSDSNLECGYISTSTRGDASWEAQVFFLKDGKYAVRAGNVEDTGSWSHVASSYWTVVVGDVGPVAQYQWDANYCWELEEDAFAEQQLAASNTVKTWPWFVQSAKGLVKDAGKFYSNAKESSEGTYEALLDNVYTSFFHSSWSASVGETHYLQAELSKATQNIQFYFKKRSQNNNNRPTTIVVSASNDGESFTEITTLDSDLPTEEAVTDYLSNVLDLGAAYKYVRFTVTATNNGAKNGGDEMFFTFSEFYVFPAVNNDVATAFNTYTAMSWMDLTASDVTTITTADQTLKSAFSTVNVTYELYEADGTTLVTSQTVVQEPNTEVNVPTTLTSNSFYEYATTGTVGSSDCTIKIVRTLKAGYVGSLADLSNSKAYTIICDRGKFLTKDDHLASTAHSSLSSAEPTAFAVLNYEDNYYLYSVADKKFVKNDGALAGDLIADGFHGTLDAIQMTPQAVPYFFWYFTVAEGTNYGLNTNGNDPYGYVINNWMNADPGNMYYMVEAADFDATEALAALEDYFHPSYTVTYVVKDGFGNTIFTSDPQPTTVGTKITTLPDEYKRTFYTYSDVDVTVTGLATEVVFFARWTGPFELSSDFASAHWYNMSMRGTWYVTSDVKDGDGAYKTQNANTMGLGEDSYQWAFSGNGYDGIKIINKAEGEGKSFGWTDAEKKNAGIPTIMDDAEGHHGWKIVLSTNTTVPSGSFCLNVPGTNLYINQYGGAGGSVKFWDSGNNVGDAGSAFTVSEVPSDFSEYVVAEVAPALEATGYFAFTDAAKTAIGYDPAFKENCPFADFKSMKQKMAAAMEDISNFVLPETGFYTLKNKNYNTFMGIDPSDANMYGNYKTAVAAKQIVKLTKKGNGTYTIGLMGKFAPATVAKSVQVTATTDEGTYTVSVPAVGYAAFQAEPAAEASEGFSALHCASGGSVVGWEASAAASQWAVEDATSIEFAVGDAGYATAYLPFPIEIGKTIAVPEAKGTWTFDDGTTDGTGVATLHASDNVAFADGAITVPVNECLKMQTGANGALTTYSFMMDVKINNEVGRYTALYSNKPDALTGDGSLFFYNNKTNGRGIGINTGGLGYGAQGSIELDTWYRVIFSCENNIPTVYVDGVKVAAATSANAETWTMQTEANFFADNDGEENEVTCDEIRFWDVALTEAEAAMLGARGTVVPEPKNAIAYTATITDGAEGTTPGDYKFLTLNEVEGAIPALTAIIVKGEPAVYNFSVLAPEAEEEQIPDGALGVYDDEVNGSQALSKEFAIIEDNDLKGTLEPIPATGLYVLAKPEGEEVGFYEAESGTIAAGKAYLKVSSDVKGFIFKFAGDDATGINAIDNGELAGNAAIYNLAGQRVSKAQKGIYIVNGKKIAVK